MTESGSAGGRSGGWGASARRVTFRAAAAAVVLSLVAPTAAAAAPKPSVTVADIVVSEAAGTASFRIKVSPRPRVCCALQVDWATADGTAVAPDDYSTRSGTVTLTRNVTSVLVTVPIAPDGLDEPNETFTVNLSNLVGTPGKIGDAQALGTIVDDDVAQSLSIDDVIVGEGDAGTGTATFTVSLSAVSGVPVSVDWATADGTAVQPGDYASGSGSLSFVPGDVSETLDVTVKGDVALEFDEVFTVGLTNPVGATIADASGIATIVDDEAAPAVSINDVSIVEGDAGTATLTFDVTLSRAGLLPASVDWTTADGTATEPGDYTADSGTVTFAAGDVSEPVDVTVNGDAVFELDETFDVELSNAVGSTMGSAQVTGTISNDDPMSEMSISDISVAEGNAGTTTASFDVTLSVASGAPASALWSTSDGTALGGADYVAGSGTVTLAAGDVSESVSVTVNGDVVDEPNETFDLNLSAPAGAALTDPLAVGTITDDDKTPTALTLRVRKRVARVIGVGRLEPAKIGFKVTVSLFRKRSNGTFVRLAARTVAVKNLRDRDGDGLKEGVYRAAFARPRAVGTYRMGARFKGTPTHAASVKRVTFVLP